MRTMTEAQSPRLVDAVLEEVNGMFRHAPRLQASCSLTLDGDWKSLELALQTRAGEAQS